MKERAFDVEIAFSPGEKHYRRHAVDHDPNGSDDHHRFSADLAGIGEAPESLPSDAADSNEQQNCVREGSENGRAAKPVRSSRGRWRLTEIVSPPGEQQPEHIAEVVSRVREQRERMRRDPKNNLRDDERDIERGANRECHSEIFSRLRGRIATIRMCARIITVVHHAKIARLCSGQVKNHTRSSRKILDAGRTVMRRVLLL